MAAASHFRGRCAGPRVFPWTLQVPKEGVRLAWNSQDERGDSAGGGPAVGGGLARAGTPSGRRRGQDRREPRPREGADPGEVVETATSPTSRRAVSKRAPPASSDEHPRPPLGELVAVAAQEARPTFSWPPGPFPFLHHPLLPHLEARGRNLVPEGNRFGIWGRPEPFLGLVVGMTAELGSLSWLLLSE